MRAGEFAVTIFGGVVHAALPWKRYDLIVLKVFMQSARWRGNGGHVEADGVH
jgi:hypothetical protein